jgi:hypothetical protein
MNVCSNDGTYHAEQQFPTQRLLGQCLLKLQEYEALLKRVLAKSAVSGPPEDVPTALVKKSSSLQKAMLGELVGKLTDDFLSPDDVGEDVVENCPQNGNIAWVKTRTQVVFSEERYIVVKAGLKELVSLRNELVHHFISKFDLETTAGCIEAEIFVERSFMQIEENLKLLQAWYNLMVQAQVTLASILNEPAFQNFIEGILPDGKIEWPRAGIVQTLRDAEECLAFKGWTDLSAAIAWIAKNAQEQRPKRYGCSSWRQVLHESRQFEVCSQPPAGLTAERTSTHAMSVWFRSPRQASPD